MKKLIILLIPFMLLVGCKETNGLIGTEVENGQVPDNIEDNLTPKEVVKLYLSFTRYGKYIMAYELLTDEQKRQQTADDIRRYSEIGKTELEKIIGVQEKDGVSVVTAAVKYTDEQTQEVRYQIKEYILTKDEEWRMIEKENLTQGQLETVKGLVIDQATAIKNSPETKEFIGWMKQKNMELLGTTKDVLFDQADNLKGEMAEVLEEYKEPVKDGVKDTVDSVKDGVKDGLQDIKGGLFGG